MYFVTFVDDYSRWCRFYFLNKGVEVLDKIKLFERHAANDSCQNIASLWITNGGDYSSPKLESYLESKGIHHELAVPTHLNRTMLQSG